MRDSLTIGIVAPSGYVTDPSALERAVRWFGDRGDRVVVDEAVALREQRFAGSDDARVASLHRMFSRDDVDIVMAARGGYGLSRLLDRIDYGLIADSGKIFCGHSDCTALQAAMWAETRTPSLAGPTACHDFGGEADIGVSEFTVNNFDAALDGSAHRIAIAVPGQPACAASGTLWGGNLCTLVHLVGTPYFPKVVGGILFIEDVYEHPYRIERMLLQLHYAGVLDAQAAVLLGSFNGYRLLDNDNGYQLESAFDLVRGKTSTPMLTGLPFGHIRDKVSLPIGGIASVTSIAGGDGWELSFIPPDEPWRRLRRSS